MIPRAVKNLIKYISLTTSLSLVLVSPAYANVGVPMIFVTLPGMLLALVPIIAIESKIHFRFFDLDKIKVIKHTALSNSVSTFIGIPIAWLAHTALFLLLNYWYTALFPEHNLYSLSGVSVLLQLTIGAAWLGPINESLSWMVPAACLFLLIPYFFASRDFGEASVPQVMSTLGALEKNNYPGANSPRVRLAILKLADGNPQALAKYTEIALADARDVLAWAEYPRWWQEIGFDRVARKLEREVIEADWQQYCQWLERDAEHRR